MTGSTSRLGVVMLCHTALARAVQVARHWARAGCPVVMHIDSKVSHGAFQRCVSALAEEPLIRFSHRFRCEWGGWGLVAASQAASQQLLREHRDVQHVYLASGSCLPLRPVEDLAAYLAERPQVDFIESATTADVPWTVGGLDEERFTMHFPFSWRRQRYLFDRAVALQRRIGIRRHVPSELTPHLGSQWWCLTRTTLMSIQRDPERARFERYFKGVWIPDESYFQTLVRRHGTQVESRSLTLSKFDFQGKPHVFYDDHLHLLRRSDCFVARKIWPHANALYRAFLTRPERAMTRTEPNPGKIDRVFAHAADRRTRGRPGLYMQSRFPRSDWENGVTAEPYSVFQGFAELYTEFQPWMAQATGMRMHGHLFAEGRVDFAGGAQVVSGAMTANPRQRDAHPAAFLRNLIWNHRGERQGFCFGPADRQDVLWEMIKDPNATIAVISGAWAIPLFSGSERFGPLRRKAAQLQKREAGILYALRSHHAKARVHIWTLADFLEAPSQRLHALVRDVAPRRARNLQDAPQMVDLVGFGRFLQRLKNQGMHPYLMGDFPLASPSEVPSEAQSQASGARPYLIR